MGRDGGVKLFSKCSIEKGSTFLHQVLDGLCDRNSAQYPNFTDQWTLEEWWDIVEAFNSLYREAARKSWKKDELQNAISDLDGRHQQLVLDCFVARRDELVQHLSKVACNLSNAQLRDFDWQLKLVLSSDKLATVQQPLVNLDLSLAGDEGNRHVSVELSKEELHSLITSLEAANRALIQLKT